MYLLLARAPLLVFVAAIVAVTVAGVWAAHVVSRDRGIADPSIVVIDEVAGQLVTLVAFPPTWRFILAGFVLFRVFDILKPWPASYFDRRVKSGFGIVADDVVAGFYAAASLWLLARFFPQLFG